MIRVELLGNTPGSLIDIGSWPAKGHIELNPADARKLGKRLIRMAEVADNGRYR